jgi:nicotinate dehydrogenase subunit A
VNIQLSVNGRTFSVDAEPETPLLYVLRNDLRLKGTRFGCGSGDCGACMVLIDGRAVPSCDIPLSAVGARSITTVEGLASGEAIHPLQRAFEAEQAAQCGFCISGMLISAKALLDERPDPTDTEIRERLRGNLCRCGTHLRIVRAIQSAAGDDH